MTGEAKKILVAEDNLALSSVLRFNLERAGFNVTVAQNGREAWDFSQIDQFDLVLTDHQMPELTGVELCQRLREDERYARTPVIMLTAKGLELDLARLRDELGVAAVLPKPFSPIEMISTIEDCLASFADQTQP